jgi:hypothetical protein
MQKRKIAGLNFLKIWAKWQETRGNCNSLQNKELREQNGSFTDKKEEKRRKMKRPAETAFLGYVTPCIIRNYVAGFSAVFKLLT